MNLAILCFVAAAAAPAPQVFYQCHRGGLDEVPENTLAALEHAWALPGGVPEVDLSTTSDGVIVLMHDDTPKRTTNAPEPWNSTPLRQIPYEEVRRWDAGSHFSPTYAGERVPQLREVFERMKGRAERQIYLDLKDVDVDALMALIREYGLEKQIIFVHGSPERCLELSKLYPGARTMTWLSGSPDKIRARFNALAEKGFAGISQLQFHLRASQTDPEIIYVFDEAFLKEAVRRTSEHGTALQVRPFEFSPGSLRKLIGLGIHWYVADAPKAFSDCVEKALAE